MSASIVSFPSSGRGRTNCSRDDTIVWDGWAYGVETVRAFTPKGLLDETRVDGQGDAQAWWLALADRWPGAVLDILGHLRAAGHGVEEIRVDHSLAMFSGRSPAVCALPTHQAKTGSSRAVMELAKTLDVEQLGDLVDQLVGFLMSRHNVAHP